MANIFAVSDNIVGTGNAYTLTEDFQNIFVAAGVKVGSTALGGRGIMGIGDLPFIEVAGQVFGTVGIGNTGSSVDVHVMAGGIVMGSFRAMDFSASATVQNDGSVSGYEGVSANGSLFLANTGSIRAWNSAVFCGLNGHIVNTGTISGTETSIVVFGQANITNSGTIIGTVYTDASADTIFNRGLIVGSVTTGAGDDLVDTAGGQIEGNIELGFGNDTFIGSSARDRVAGGGGQDELDAGGGNDIFLIGDNDGRDVLDGGTGTDFYDARGLTGALILDLTQGEARNQGQIDLLTGIEGVIGGAGNDRITGDVADNVLRGGAGADQLAGMAGNDRLFGEGGRNGIFGGDGNDRLYGGDVMDTLDGGAGNDRIFGSYDIDRMTGGTGADRFIFSDFEEFIPIAVAGLDRITDFVKGEDLIDLRTIDAIGTIAGDQAFSFVGTAAITDFGQIGFRTTASATFISIGFNSASAFDVIRLDGVFALTAADFLL